MLVAELSSWWSHARGGRHPQPTREVLTDPGVLRITQRPLAVGSRCPNPRVSSSRGAEVGHIAMTEKGAYGVRLVRGPFVRLPPHRLAVDQPEELNKVLPKLRRPLAADLFCGAGGLSLGLSEAGFDVVLAIDNDEDALETHRSLHPGLSVNWDLGDEDVVEMTGNLISGLGVTLVAGGPPCQPFSRAGRSALRDLVRRGRRPDHDLREDLWESFLRIVSIAQPPAVLLENVPDMALDRDMWILRYMVDELEEMNYAVEERLIPTSEYGVPQHRQRLILVALADRCQFSWPKPSTAVVSLRNAIGDLPKVEGGWRPNNGDNPSDPVASGWKSYKTQPRTGFQRRMRRDVPDAQRTRVYDHVTRPVREDDARIFAQMDSKTKYTDVAEELRRYRGDIFDDKYNRLDWDGLSRTITAHISKDGYGFIHPDQDRTLTVREAARIQTFPDDVRFAGPPSAAFRQIGNAVPPLLAEQLGTAILASLEHPNVETWSTSETSGELAKWFRRRKRLTIPWLRAETRWQVIQAEVLWNRIAPEYVQEAWAAVAALPTPTATLDVLNMRTLLRYARLRGREDRIQQISNLAEWFRLHPKALDANASVEVLGQAPGMTPALAGFVALVCPGRSDEAEEPVIATDPTLRVAARALGENVARQRKLSDGRLAIARMVGGDDWSRDAHLALFELAASLCSPKNRPDCGHCPLLDQCVFASEEGYQTVLPLTNQAV
jgi:DNA (cytosine-5)-methyltransferase 1